MIEGRMRKKKHSIIYRNIILPDSQPTSIDEEGCQVKGKDKVRGGKHVQVCERYTNMKLVQI